VGGFLYICNMKSKSTLSLDDRKQNILNWLKSDKNDLEYINYNKVLKKLQRTESSLATDWGFIYKTIKSEGLKTFLSDNKIYYSDLSEISKSLLETNKKIFYEWLILNHHKIERLSFISIEKYIKENCSEMSKVWSNIYGNLKQEGLIKWFQELNFTFYVQDNKKDLNHILNELYLVASVFFKEHNRTPSFYELRDLNFKYVNYLVRDGWNLNWTIDKLNDFYLSKGLPKILSKSEIKTSELRKVDIDLFLDDIHNYYGNLPSLRTLKIDEKFYDFVRFLRLYGYDKNKTENEVYQELLQHKYGEDYVKLTDKLISLDGHWCDSIYELILFNFRYLNELPNNPHVRYDDIFPVEMTNLVCDLHFENDFICEIAGYNPTIEKHNGYWKKMSEKEKMCERYEKPFLRIDAYKYISTKLEDYVNYLYSLMLDIYPKFRKFELIDLIKSQNTSDYIKSIMNYFNKTNLISIENMKENLTSKEFRFFMNMWGSLTNFKSFYENGGFSFYTELSCYNIDFDSKKYKKPVMFTPEEKIERGIKSLAQYIKNNNLDELPSSSQIEKDEEFRFINDMFRENSYWKNISLKMEGYNKLCVLLGFQIKVNRKVDGWYKNRQNVIDILIHMKNINNVWMGSRKASEIDDKQILKLYNYINQKLKGINNFKTIYQEELKKLNLI